MASSPDTIAAPATPAGTSALAIVRASGPLAARLWEAIFSQAPLPRQAHHGDYRDRTGALIDDVVAVFFRGPNSYSGEDIIEVSCHGNPFIIHKILDDLYSRGCRPAEPGEFTKRAFLNGRLGLSEAEAVADLIRARSDRALAAANQQLRGALGRRLQVLADQLLDLVARVEAQLDFPEEDLPPEDRTLLLDALQRLHADTARLLAGGHYAEILRDGLKTVILGPPNAGKSSLLNRLVGRERALVSPEPGTTRDYLEERITLGPHCIRLIDTAGLNTSPAPLERLGMAKALEHAAGADLILLILDATRPAPALPEFESLPGLTAENALLVVNKIDLVPSGPFPPGPRGVPAVRISALTGAGCDELVAAIARHAESFRSEQDEEVIAINSRHAEALGKVAGFLYSAIEKLRAGASADEFLASDLRGALNSFGEILGTIDNEKVLDRIFATFCIGK